MAKTFNYAGHTFEGVRLFTENEDFHTIVRELYYIVNISNWNWSEFYSEAEKDDENDFDVFMMDDKWLVVPCHNNLFIFGQESDKNYRRYLEWKQSFDISSDDYASLKNELFLFLTSWLQENGPIEIPADCFIPFVREVDGDYVTHSIQRIYHPKDEDLHIVFNPDQVHLDLLAVVTTECRWVIPAQELDVTTLFQITKALKL